jgi:hypothetical protein
MSDERSPQDIDQTTGAASTGSGDAPAHGAASPADFEEEVEAGPAPTPFDHPFFLPAVCIGFTVWFGYDTYIHPMEEYMDFNFYGFRVVLAAAVWYSYLAWCEIKEVRVMPWVLPAIFAALAAWLGAEAFELPGFSLPELVEYPMISKGGFYVALAMIPVSALREWLRWRRAAGASDGSESAA